MRRGRKDDVLLGLCVDFPVATLFAAGLRLRSELSWPSWDVVNSCHVRYKEHEGPLLVVQKPGRLLNLLKNMLNPTMSIKRCVSQREFQGLEGTQSQRKETTRNGSLARVGPCNEPPSSPNRQLLCPKDPRQRFKACGYDHDLSKMGQEGVSSGRLVLDRSAKRPGICNSQGSGRISLRARPTGHRNL